MGLRQPESMEDCIYFTRRSIGNGQVMAWVFRKECPQCHKSLMAKPRDKKGKVMIRAKEYVCSKCGFSEDKKTHEETLTLNIKYGCPYCKYEGETTTEYKRKVFEGVPSYVFTCEKCRKKIGITKKLKEGKK
jgi:predicted RNA-binding Zn-ribbon protein involved in translation (DUF1610 family)